MQLEANTEIKWDRFNGYHFGAETERDFYVAKASDISVVLPGIAF